MQASFLSHAKIFGSFTLLTRIFGLIREILSAAIFGAGAVWDAFLIAFIIPNLTRRIFGEGALSSAFIPIFVDRLKRESKESAFKLLNVLLGNLGLVLMCLVILGLIGVFFIPQIWGEEKLHLVCDLLKVMLPFLFFICITAILGAALNSMEHFAIPAATPALFNLLLIGALWLICPLFGKSSQKIFVLAWTVIFAGIAGMILQLPPLLKRGMKVSPTINFEEKGMKEIYQLFLPVLFGLSLFQINELLDYFIAEFCVKGHGAVSALGYSMRITHLPIALIGTAIAVVIFPRLAGHLVEGSWEEFSHLFTRAIRITLFIAIPASLGLIVLAEPVVEVLFERGAFTHLATIRTKTALSFYAAGIWCYCLNQILMRVFYAQKDSKTPMKVSIIGICANFLLNIILVWPLKEAGIALATAITGCSNVLILLGILKKRLKLMDLIGLIKIFLQGLVLAIMMAFLACRVYDLASVVLDSSSFGNALALGIAILFGITFYIFLARILRIKEAKDLLTSMIRR
jgi:putative peptidoglycan lipid II flippase